MSPNQQAILFAILKHWQQYSIPPTIRYLQKHTHIKSSSTIHYYYRKLAQDKLIILSAGPGADPKPVPVSIFNLITKGVSTK